MKTEEFQNKLNSIQEKIGKDASSLILDDLAVLITDNQNMNKDIETKDSQIENLKKTNETLQTVNGNLLQQIGVEDDPDTKQKEEDKKSQPFDFRSCFDEKRKFQKII